MTKNTDLGALLERAKETLPWAYKPQEHDDWGTIRSTVVGEHGWCPVVANSRGGSGDDFSTHRANKTDPFEPYGQLIVAAVNALPALLSHSTRQAERIAELEAVLRPFAEACTISNLEDDDCIQDRIAADRITFGHLRSARAALS